MPATSRIPLVLLLVLIACAGCRGQATAVATVPAARTSPDAAATGGEARLRALRTRIDSVDAALLELVGARLAIAREIGAVKQEMHLPVVDSAREAVVVERFTRRAQEYGVNEPLARALILRLIEAARAEQ